MTQRFFIDSAALVNFPQFEWREAEMIRQLGIVLRYAPGDMIEVLPNDGRVFQVKLTEFKKNVIRGELLAEIASRPFVPQAFAVVLPKSKDKWEFLLQKLTELGVNQIYPLQSEFGVGKYPADSERIQRILKEAAEQSEQFYLPTLFPLKSLSSFLAQTSNLIFGDLRGEAEDLWTFLNRVKREDLNKLIPLIGPEGGFSAAEIARFDEMKIKGIGLSKSVLRLETAAILWAGLLKIRQDFI
ncbi:MAG TPA: RsmE family RNA methyltransferase [Candidatus Gracilibacteria bacterium]|nr:RsmE family RNA methyltransferase [Candidatus Gracilibacteria bacterium]